MAFRSPPSIRWQITSATMDVIMKIPARTDRNSTTVQIRMTPAPLLNSAADRTPRNIWRSSAMESIHSTKTGANNFNPYAKAANSCLGRPIPGGNPTRRGSAVFGVPL